MHDPVTLTIAAWQPDLRDGEGLEPCESDLKYCRGVGERGLTYIDPGQRPGIPLVVTK